MKSSLLAFLPFLFTHDGQPFSKSKDQRYADSNDGHTQAIDKFLFRCKISFAMHMYPPPGRMRKILFRNDSNYNAKRC